MSKIFLNYSLVGASLTACLVLTACSGGSNKLPVLNDEVLSGSANNGFVSLASSQGGSISNIKKLVIPAFNVTYKLKVEGTAVTMVKEGDKEVTTSTDMKVNMEDADVAMLQAMTNKAYNVFVAELKKAKFEVVALNDVAKSDAYYQVNHKNLVTSVSIDDERVTMVPDGLKLYDPNEKMDPDGSFLMGVANINSAVSGDLVEVFGGENNGVASLSVNMTVQFGNFDLEDHRVSSSIAFNPSFTVMGDETNMEMITGFRKVSMPGRVFYIPEESAAYGLSQDMGSKTSVIEGMLNVSSEEGAEEYNAAINADAFEKAGVEQIARVSQLLIKAATDR
ncbi:MAG: hypothetical protein KAJ92_02325 [Gammaproteobacteria bacterium]|nr:hypothetical protein [Gammaproteobacteria bacterium]